MSEEENGKEKDEKGGELTPYKQQDVGAFFGIGGTTQYMSFSPQTPEGARLMIAASLGECSKIKDVLNLELSIKHLYAHPATTYDPETGAEQTWTRIVLITPDGKCIECGSDGIKKSIALIALMRGNPPWNPPVRCNVKVESLRGGRQFYKLIPIVEAIAPNKRGQGGR